MAAKLTEEQEAFLAWSILPEDERIPRTREQLALALGVTAETLRRWKHTAWYREELARAYAERNADPERMQAVVDAIYTAAAGGDVRAATQYLDYLRSIGALQVQVEDRNIEDMTDEELEEAWSSVLS